MSALLSTENVDKAFGAVRSLVGVSLEIEEHRIVGLIGPNGAGKSTFINVVAGVYPPDRGRITFAGRTLDGISTAGRARLGLVRTFQRPMPIFTLSCVDGVMIGGFARGLGMQSARHEALALLERIGLRSLADRSPRTLSTGQLKLLDFARVLMLRPRAVLLDELMSGLSKAEIELAQSAIQSLASEGVTFLLVEHLMDVIRRLSQHLIVMDAGVVIAAGAPDDVIRQDVVVQAYLGGDAEEADA